MKKYSCDCCKIVVDSEVLSNFNDVNFVYVDDKLLCNKCLIEYDKNHIEHELIMFIDGKKLSNENRTILVNVDKVKKTENKVFGTRFDVWFKVCGKVFHGIKTGDDMLKPFKCKIVKTITV